jgi:mannose-6-phosphate isomerase-like protein (cupin superfamily)
VPGVVLIGSTDAPVEVTGAHGGTSSLLWKRFSDGNMMYSDLASFEHVTVPPGGNVGLHVHSRTEEIYFIISGRGRMRVDDETREVGRGDLILTPLHSAQSFEVLGDEPATFIVMEMLPPEIVEVLPAHSPTAAEA